MPHSSRLHRGRLWLVQSGTGEFGHVDLATGRFEPLCFLQGFARGVAFRGDHAVIGVSAREPHLRGARAQRAAGARGRRAGLSSRGGEPRGRNVEHRLTIEGVVEELYDVAVLPGVIRPSVLGFRTEDIRFLVRRPCAERG